jgi:ABC-type transport system involved in multi-copper enzyme maturation permease subunit
MISKIIGAYRDSNFLTTLLILSKPISRTRIFFEKLTGLYLCSVIFSTIVNLGFTFGLMIVLKMNFVSLFVRLSLICFLANLIVISLTVLIVFSLKMFNPRILSMIVSFIILFLFQILPLSISFLINAFASKDQIDNIFGQVVLVNQQNKNLKQKKSYLNIAQHLGLTSLLCKDENINSFLTSSSKGDIFEFQETIDEKFFLKSESPYNRELNRDKLNTTLLKKYSETFNQVFKDQSDLFKYFHELNDSSKINFLNQEKNMLTEYLSDDKEESKSL